MIGKVKIFNDPVYGFVSIAKSSILLDIIDHRYFQRLRRISQTALTNYVYAGANHTRFHHALGALHLMQQAVGVLRQKGVEITAEESEGVCIAILLHDIGHGPFSHTLEHTILDAHHEALSLAFMEQLNVEFGGKLDIAISIFKNTYSKHFLHQLVSGQLDMDRMDYLNRDSFFTGVSEGVIGYDRIIKMLNVVNGELVVEEKGIYSIEKFLIARRLMYWQVYLHKTVLSAEQMLMRILRRAKEIYVENKHSLEIIGELRFFFENTEHKNVPEMLEKFALLDDYDIIANIKQWTNATDYTLSYLSKSLINRRLFKVELQNTPFSKDIVEKHKLRISAYLPKDTPLDYFLFLGEESNRTYNKHNEAIKILRKDGSVESITDTMDYELNSKIIKKYYLCYVKFF